MSPPTHLLWLWLLLLLSDPPSAAPNFVVDVTATETEKRQQEVGRGGRGKGRRGEMSIGVKCEMI